jgi:hypothetical protein
LAISNAHAAKINKMNKASQNVSLGTVVQNLQSGSATLNGYIRSSGSASVSQTQASASTVTIATGLTGIKGFIVQAYTSASIMTGLKVVNSGSNLDVTAGSSVGSTPKSLGLNDAVNWIVW